MEPSKPKHLDASQDSDPGRDEELPRAGLVARPDQARKVLVDAEEMKQKIRQAAIKPPYDVCNFYHEKGLWQAIARHQTFEYITLGVIAFNALWISIDTDLNHSADLLSAHAVFQVAEHGFCLYFSFEWLVRFKSFKKKRNGLKDAWFVFDSTLVFMMVGETWIMTVLIIALGGGAGGGLGNASMLRMARLLRLSRMARMARLFRAMPELLILIKAMVASIRSCGFVFVLLTLILYVFGIAFRQLTDGLQVGEDYFPTVLEAMHTLWIDGTLMDGTGDLVKALRNESLVLLTIFYVFVCLSALAVMNMLIGIICEVVSAVAATEKESLQVNWVKMKLQDIIRDSGLDEDGNGTISKEEFSKLLEFPEACKAIDEVGVDVYMLVDNIDFIFEGDGDNDDEEDKALSFEDFMGLLLDLRGSNTATVKDVIDLQKFIQRSIKRLRDELANSRSTVAREAQKRMPYTDHGAMEGTVRESKKPIGLDLPIGPTYTKESAANQFDDAHINDALWQVMRETILPALSEIRTSVHQDLPAELHKLSVQFDAIRMRDPSVGEHEQILLQSGIRLRPTPSSIGQHRQAAWPPEPPEYSEAKNCIPGQADDDFTTELDSICPTGFSENRAKRSSSSARNHSDARNQRETISWNFGASP